METDYALRLKINYARIFQRFEIGIITFFKALQTFKKLAKEAREDQKQKTRRGYF